MRAAVAAFKYFAIIIILIAFKCVFVYGGGDSDHIRSEDISNRRAKVELSRDRTVVTATAANEEEEDEEKNLKHDNSVKRLKIIGGKYSDNKETMDDDVIRYTNRWTVVIRGGAEKVNQIAKQMGFEVDHENFKDYYLKDTYTFIHPKHPKNGKFENVELTNQLKRYQEVLWAKQVSMIERKVRSVTCPRRLPSSPNGGSSTSGYLHNYNDPLWPGQFYMHDCRVSKNDGPVYDLNVVPVFAMGITGLGVNIVIVDDGVETDHPDLLHSYDETLGLDLVDNNNTPDPIHTTSHTFWHGTRCAGVIVMEPNNKLCGVGVAPAATLGAIRLLGNSPSDDYKDAKALSFRLDKVDIFSNSWGPNDDGKTMAHLGKYAESAIKHGIKTGRNGKGTIYVFAGGNGKRDGDTCACDGYVSNIYTIAIASCDEYGRTAHYSERCTSIIAATYSGGGDTANNVVTTDVHKSCTTQHTGTSATGPMVAGVIALALQANPKLTWRCIQHLLVWTSEVAPFENNFGWKMNAANLYVSNDFGFGSVNAYNLVLLAKTFEPVPPMATCVVPIKLQENEITRLNGLEITFQTDGCKGLPAEVKYIEHVQLLVDATYTRRGDLQIMLTSAQGTFAHIFEGRKKDSYTKGIANWAFDCLHFWGEAPAGTWTVQFVDKTGWLGNHGTVNDLMLVIHGTAEMPKHYKKPRAYYKMKFPNSPSP